jgi:hypothetical protein
MTVEHFQETLDMLMARQPFKPFTIELNTGRRLEVDHPSVAAYKDGAGAFLAPGGIPTFFDHESVNQIINSPAHSAPGRKKGKPQNGK